MTGDNRGAKPGGLIGSALPRREDRRLLTGTGCFTADPDPAGQLHAVFVRAPVAHAALRGLDLEEAPAQPGVRLVLTAAEVARAGLGALRAGSSVPDQRPVERPLIAGERVRHLGEILAMVVAESPDAARDAAELIVPDLEALPTLVDPEVALAPESPQLHEIAPRNLAYDWQKGDGAAVEAGLARAAQRVTVTVENPRVVINPLEPRAAIAFYDPATERYQLEAPTQGTHRLRDILAEQALGIEPERLRVITRDVGGAFGIRLQSYPEMALLLLAARLTGRPVRWVAERSEAFLCDAQGRGQRNRVELALDEAGHFLALRVESLADLGAYYSTYAATIPTLSGTRVLGHCYRFPALETRVRALFTSLPPVDAYRGAGKPELVYALERAIEVAARERGETALALRRRNLIAPADLPYRTGLGETIDCGDFPGLLAQTLRRADWSGFEARRAAAAAAGRLAGIGLGTHYHATGGSGIELSRLCVEAEGRVLAFSGTQAGGQGHETAFAQLVADRLELEFERVVLRQGDSGALPRGGGTGGSSGVPVAATNLARACGLLIARGQALAAEALAVPADQVAYAAGYFTARDSNRGIGLFELAGFAAAQDEDFSAACDFEGERSTYPNGCYVAEVEIDPETGAVALTRFTGLDDLGNLINPPIAAGQVQGGIAQSVGQALLEHTAYDPENGQLLSGSLMDYALPRAADLPPLDLGFAGIPTRVNALGAKGVGELGNIGAIAPVVNAVLDALGPLGVTDLAMPLTPERVWRAIRDAEAEARG